ncbi:MAG: aspartate aminotransferase family protein [Synergistaceae bacterium]|jgi:4-aminobutyrate aminotransferase|nr:aspartate aminotransferase family protein [Synergistaceae bacterium]
MLRNIEGDINESENRREWRNGMDGRAAALLEADERLFFRQSLSSPCINAIKSAQGIYIEDMSGKRYMDFHGNNVHQLGYGNPYVRDALLKQLSELAFSPRRYTNRAAVELAERLCRLMPGGNYKTLFTPSGASSVSVALKLARAYTGRYKVISLWNSFHGANLDTISVGGEGVFRCGAGPLMPGCEHIMPYNSYRCMFGDCGTCGLKCLDYMDYVMKCEGDVGAVLMETVRSTDVHIPPAGYYPKLKRICEENGAALILDEIPTALGRTGKMFAFDNYDVAPDILIIGKGLGGGMIPMSAVLAKAEMDVCGDTSIGHYTHEKNPLGSACAMAVIDYISMNGVLEHVNAMEAILRKALSAIKENCEIIGDVRSIGLLAGVEFVKSRSTKEKAPDLAEKVMYGCLRNGLSFKVSGGNIITLTPPLVITQGELETAMDILREAISEAAG